MEMNVDKEAKEVWEAFCNELTQPPADDMREALASAIRKLIDRKDPYVMDAEYGKRVANWLDGGVYLAV